MTEAHAIGSHNYSSLSYLVTVSQTFEAGYLFVHISHDRHDYLGIARIDTIRLFYDNHD